MADKKKPDYTAVFFGTPRRALISCIGIFIVVALSPLLAIQLIIAAKSITLGVMSIAIPLIALMLVYRVMLRKLRSSSLQEPTYRRIDDR